MKISKLHISNFRGIKEVDLSELGDMIIIAGQNGSGKSCVFDAIRLLKSAYGGYIQNEWHHWMGEFQINLTSRNSDYIPLLNDPQKSMKIECDFQLSEEERCFIQENADELLREKIWREILPEAYGWGGLRLARFGAQFREKEPYVAERAEQERSILISELANQTIRGICQIPVGGSISVETSICLSVIFSTFRPRQIGVIDYHGAQRHYNREIVQSINFNLVENEQQNSQNALYNSANKYNNVKSELGASYIKDVLARESDSFSPSQYNLTETLVELFTIFFPDKTFVGPKPTPSGNLSFPVKTSSGNMHDLDDLSAGEKEILYGYLRIRNSAPRFSIILLDEPELHLNPRLVRGLPQFYKKHLGETLENQIWLVTHSDALLREVVGKENYKVFHMLPCSQIQGKESQLKLLSATADVDLALVDLVGDLASFRPGGKVVIFEGGGDSDFDQQMTGRLFPELQKSANLVSGSNKIRVRALHETLERVSEKGTLPFKFYSITDKDSDIDNSNSKKSINSFTWEVYHIENYFLNEKYISKALIAVGVTNSVPEDVILSNLRDCAKETLPILLRHDLSEIINSLMVRSMDFKTNPEDEDIIKLLDDSIERSISRINTIRKEEISKPALTKKESELRTKYENSLSDGNWLKIFRGRDILKRFTQKYTNGVSYDVFRNIILDKMCNDGFQPEGMKKIIEKILK